VTPRVAKSALPAILAAWLASGGTHGADRVAPGPGTREMAALLAERAAGVDPMRLAMVVNDRRAEALSRQLARPMPASRRIGLRAMAATELIHAGRIDDALLALDALKADALQHEPGSWGRHERLFRMMQVSAFMRMAEDQNCHRNNRDACLLPIQGEGVHVIREGSTRAIAVLEEILADDPSDLRARWLLNVAHMTLGGYPARVPARHLVPPSAFASEFALPRFPNVAREAGIELLAHAGGAVTDDFDGDGRLDVLTSSMGFDDPLHLFRNRGDGSFEDVAGAAGLAGETGGLNLLQADYDNDGDVDVLVLRGGWLGAEGAFPMSLLRNEGDGTFEDVTRAAGLLRFAPTQTATWLDYDGDGRLDLYVGNESQGGDRFPCQLFHNDGDGRFSERAAQAGVDVVAFVKAVVSGDYDNDGRPDLYVSVVDGDNKLFRNDGPAEGGGWRFRDVAAKAGVVEPHASFGALFFDYDDDGWLDLFVAGYGSPRGLPAPEDVAADYLGLPTDAERGRLFRNRGDGTFEDATRKARLFRVVPAMGLNFGDLDNDGWLDLYLGTGTPDLGMLVPNRMFRNDGKGGFQDVTTAGNFGHLQKGHGVAFADLDNDGDQDVFEQMGGAYRVDTAYSALYLNPGNANGWLGLELEGTRTNRKGLGARIRVAVDGPSGRRVLHRTVGSGGSFGASPLRQEIGLGPAPRVAWVEIAWPVTGAVQRLEGLAPSRHYRVREGAAAAVALERPSFPMPRRASR
jgi:hypothetical protein